MKRNPSNKEDLTTTSYLAAKNVLRIKAFIARSLKTTTQIRARKIECSKGTGLIDVAIL
jgi:hypothetical protein